MAKDVITRFKLETTGFDSKIKQAAKDLSAYSKTATQAKEGFNQFTKANIDAARALGTIATSTTNVKDRVKELVGAYNDAAKAYEALSDEQKQSDWAKALAGSLTQLQQRIKETKAEMQGLGNSMGDMGGGGIFSGLGSKMEGALAVFGGNLMTNAAGAVAQLGSEMADMVKQGIEMAKAGEGIRIAFERLGNGQILDGLREATHGTVTDLELMKAAVKFNDFKLPVEELGTMLAFAQQKAKDTGQSVDYMVDSIVTGLGRKSLMILDNLGLSASEVRERMKETGDMTKAVGAIIREQMASAGDYVETAADRAAQANVILQNKMEELGRKFAPLQEASNTFWTSFKISILDIVGGPLADFLNGLTEAGRRMKSLQQLQGGGNGQPTKVDRQLSALRGSNFKNEKYRSQMSQYDQDIRVAEYFKKKYQNASIAGGAVLSDVSKRFNIKVRSGEDIDNLINNLKLMRSEYQKSAKEIMAPVKADIDTTQAEQSVASLKKQLKELEKQRKKAVKSGDQEQVEALTKQISQTKTNLGYLDPSAVKSTTGGTTTKTDIQFADDSIMAQEKLVSELTLKWKTASVELREGYLKDLEEAQKKLAEMTGKAKGDGAPTFTMAQLEGMSFDSRMPELRGNDGRAQDKLDLATAAFATGGTSNIDISNYISGIKNALSNANLGDDLYNSMTEKLKDATTVSTLLQEMMERGLAGADLETTAQALKEKLLSPEGIDQTAVQSFLEGLNKQIEEAGGVGLKLNADTGEVTDDKDKGDDGLEEMKKFNEGIGKLSGGLSQVTGGLKAIGIEIPKEVDQVIGVINGVSQIISGVGTIMSIFGTTAITANTTAVGLNTAAIAGLIAAIEINTATNFIPFARGGIVPVFAHGGLIGRAALGMTIPGNSFSGDNLRLPVDGGRGWIGVNSGELILNKSSQNNLASSLLRAEELVSTINDVGITLSRAQQGALASQLEGGGRATGQPDVRLSGEDIYVALNNYTQRAGYGEIVTSR